jgi:hypothetical protein
MSQTPPNANVPPAAASVPTFPCGELPSDVRHARLLGIYPQRQQGLWMRRVRIPGGILSAGQWRALAEIARRLTPTAPLHLTTRQDVELHDLSAADVPRAEKLLAEAGLTSLGSGGDTLRNITVCPCAAGGIREVPDLLPLAGAIGRVLAAVEGIFSLPRKFKISLGCRQGCGRPFIHDLAFVAEQRDAQWGLQVVGAGSLGPKPATGIVLSDWIAPTHAPAAALAGVRLFARLGDRQNRGRARLRHVRQRLGDEAFLTEWRRELDAAKADRPWPALAPASPPAAAPAGRITLTFPNGDVPLEARTGQECQVAVVIDNKGVAPLYRPYRLALRFSQGRTHRVVCLAQDVRQLLPDLTHFRESFTLPAGLQPGEAKVSLGIIDSRQTPAVRLAIKAVDADGWHPLTSIDVRA